MSSVRVEAPAKVNLGLRIRGRRPDGYHLIESLFVPLEWADTLLLELRPSEGVALRVEGGEPGVLADERNLAFRAAQSFLAATGLDAGVGIALRKRLPAAAGLGGGSSDAGAVLRGLDQLRPGMLSRAELARLALSLGADVPYFLDPRPARVWGIGEGIEPLAGVPSLSLLLAHPGTPLRTSEVYAAFDAAPDSLTPAGAGPTIDGLSALLSDAASERARVEGLLGALRGGLLENDLEVAATRLCPAVRELRRELEGVGSVAVGLSGSGPTVFGVFASPEGAREARQNLSLSPPARCWVAATTPSS